MNIPIDWTPSESEIERAWIMRQSTLDAEAGIEPDPLRYSAEFRRYVMKQDRKIRAKETLRVARWIGARGMVNRLDLWNDLKERANMIMKGEEP